MYWSHNVEFAAWSRDLRWFSTCIHTEITLYTRWQSNPWQCFGNRTQSVCNLWIYSKSLVEEIKSSLWVIRSPPISSSVQGLSRGQNSEFESVDFIFHKIWLKLHHWGSDNHREFIIGCCLYKVRRLFSRERTLWLWCLAWKPTNIISRWPYKSITLDSFCMRLSKKSPCLIVAW